MQKQKKSKKPFAQPRPGSAGPFAWHGTGHGTGADAARARGSVEGHGGRADGHERLRCLDGGSEDIHEIPEIWNDMRFLVGLVGIKIFIYIYIYIFSCLFIYLSIYLFICSICKVVFNSPLGWLNSSRRRWSERGRERERDREYHKGTIDNYKQYRGI